MTQVSRATHASSVASKLADNTSGAISAQDVREVITDLEDSVVWYDEVDAAAVQAAGALMDSEVTNLAQVKAFDTTDYATAAQGATADSALQDVADDTTPQLGGDLDVNGNSIVSTSNSNIVLAPNGTGDIVLGTITLDGDQSVGAPQDNYVLTYDNATGKIQLEAAPGSSGGDAWSDPVDSDILFDGDGTRSIGNGTNRAASVHTDSIDLGGTTLDGTQLADPGADRILFWDDSAGTTTYLEAGTGLSITGTTMAATGLVDVVDDTTPQLGGDLDGQGNEVANYTNAVVGSVSGTLTVGAHSGNVIVTSGNVTVPTTAGFTCVIIAGGAHTVTFNSTTSAAMAAGDVMTVVVEDATTIHAVLTAAADKVSFS